MPPKVKIIVTPEGRYYIVDKPEGVEVTVEHEQEDEDTDIVVYESREKWIQGERFK